MVRDAVSYRHCTHTARPTQACHGADWLCLPGNRVLSHSAFVCLFLRQNDGNSHFDKIVLKAVKSPSCYACTQGPCVLDNVGGGHVPVCGCYAGYIT